MKVWRNAHAQQPNEFETCLAKQVGEEYAFVAYWDGDRWFECHSGEPLENIELWMYVPLYPNE